jgi:hypothetical protein
MTELEKYDMRDDIRRACIQLLNEAFKADPAAMHALIVNRVPCNKALAEHPLIPVSYNTVLNSPETTYYVGMLGIINGILDKVTGNTIFVQCGEDCYGDGFRRIIGFGIAKKEGEATHDRI